MAKINKVAVLGSGAFGIAQAMQAAKKSDQVYIYSRSQYICDYINQNHCHPKKLTDVKLRQNIHVTNNLRKALEKTGLIIVAVPMDALEQTLRSIRDLLEDNAVLVSTSKGILKKQLLLPLHLVEKHLKKKHAATSCYLSGPSFAREVAKDYPTALSLASFSQISVKTSQQILSSKEMRIYISNDPIGVCIGGAMKNVIAIASGACVGLNLGKNSLAALITRGLGEINRLALAFGANPNTLFGLSGMGDLVLSCTDDMSRNFRLGKLLASNISLEDAQRNINSVVEGAKTALAIPLLIEKYGIDMPISKAVFDVLYSDVPIKKAMSSLLSRKLKTEF